MEENEDNVHKDSKKHIKSGTVNLAQQEQDEMELIKHKEKVDSLKVELITMNKNLNGQ
jgi:hypothetical protein